MHYNDIFFVMPR